MIKDLNTILNEIPILMSPYLKGVDRGMLRTAEGVAVQRQKNGKTLKYTVLNYNCDDLAKGLLHESIHHYDIQADEWYVKQVENLLWDKPQFRRSCQNKIVEMCERYDL